MTNWGCPECGAEHLQGRSYGVLVDRTTPSFDESGRVDEHENAKEERFVDLERFLQERGAEDIPELPELYCPNCGARFNEAVPVGEGK